MWTIFLYLFNLAIKNVQGAVVVNTERLVKGVSGGTYARLQITGEKFKVQVKAEVVRIWSEYIIISSAFGLIHFIII